MYATESAMNELADLLKIDPVKLRTLNEPKKDESLDLPFSSRHLLECYELGSQKFGWAKRTPEVGSMKRDGLTLGWGMASCAWIAARFPAEASVELKDDGTVRVACGTQDIGTGTYTILAQLAADKTGVPLEKVEAVLGDSIASPRPALGRLDGHGFRGAGGVRSGRSCHCVALDARNGNAGIAIRKAQFERVSVPRRQSLCEGR